MRLIDADALIKTLETYKFGAIQNEVERAYIKETVINFVKDAPTAYDPEKVADCLKKASTLVQYSKRTCKFAIEQDLAVHIVRIVLLGMLYGVVGLRKR